MLRACAPVALPITIKVMTNYIFFMKKVPFLCERAVFIMTLQKQETDNCFCVIAFVGYAQPPFPPFDNSVKRGLGIAPVFNFQVHL